MGMLELLGPVQFEPVGPVTSVFFDDKNQEVFSVRSGGATGVTIKSANTAKVVTTRISDLGPIISIKLSPCHTVLSVQRSKNQVDFLNLSTPEMEYSQVARAKNCIVLGFIWTQSSEVVFVTDLGIEIYSVNSEKRSVKYVRSSSVGIAWFCSCPKENFIVTGPKLEAQSLQVWSIRGGSAYKVGSIEPDVATLIKERCVAILRVYESSYLALQLGDEGSREVRLHRLGSDSVQWTHSLAIANVAAGPLGLQVVDSLVLLHSQSEGRTWVYDLRLGGQGGPAQTVTTLQPALPPTALCIKDTGYSQPLAYSPSWVLFRPHVIVDARVGHMWTLQLRLDSCEGGEPITLTRLLLNRQQGKPPLLALLRKCLCSPTLPLPTLGQLFTEVVTALHSHLNQTLPAASVVLDQPDLFTHLFSPNSAQGVPVPRLQAGLVELLLSLAHYSIPPRQFFHELLINLAVKSGKFYQLHQLLQYGVLGDSKQVACLLLSLESAYQPARQLALDMMARLGTATEEMVEIFLAEGKLISALQLVRAHGLVDSVSARKFLEAAEKTKDSLLFFNVFSFFEERNLRLRGSGKFSPGEQCQPYVQKFKTTFLDSNENDTT